MTKDYYKILDIPEFSTQDEIKCAYRKMARKWHPDIAGNASDVISKFKEINEAYEILSDKTKKADYDTARKFYNYAANGAAKRNAEQKDATNPNQNTSANTNNYYQKTNKKSGFNFNWEEFLSKKHAENQLKKEKKNFEEKRGEDIYTDIEISVFEAVNGAQKTINMLQTQACPKCKGRKFVNNTICSHCNGKGEISNHKKFSVKIPAGIKDKSKIRLAGEGECGVNGGKSGDLYLTVHIIEPKNYKTDGLNILKTIGITPYEAVLGCHITVSTIKGNVSVKIAPNTKNGQKIRLNGCGIESPAKTGDMIATIEIQTPENLTNEEIMLYKRLQEIAHNRNERKI